MLLLKLTAENLDEGLIYTIFGFSVVLIVLLLITALLYGFSAVVLGVEKRRKAKIAEKIVKPEEKEETPKEEVAPKPPVIEKPVEVIQPVNNDEELVAVITAAIAASLGTSTDKLVVRSIRKVNSWKKETIRQNNRGLY